MLISKLSSTIPIPKKSPGYDLITGKILQELPTVGIKYLTHLFNAVLLLNYFPSQWKVAHIILILKPGKTLYALTSYRPISLLPIVSKVFEKLLLTQLLPIVGQWLNTFPPVRLQAETLHH
jgi:hypothetical protein